ncbi:MAG: diguanylate cyclase, partial [Oscillospiraceae bacterium]
NKLQAAVICEFFDDRIELIRVNEAYYALVGYDDMVAKSSNILDALQPQYRAPLLHAFHTCAQTLESTACEYMRRRTNGTDLWIGAKLRYVTTVGSKHILIVELTDITMRKGIDAELQKYKDAMMAGDHDARTVLIVDDGEINRIVLKKILGGQFSCLEAENGQEALAILQSHENQVDIILLDINMPVMDGKTFLQRKQHLPDLAGIPVIMITADDSPEQQTSTFSLGANDYIVKPFIPAVVTRRVSNVLESNHRFKEMVREYNDMSVRAKTDLMTGLINRVSAEEMITQRLKSATGTCIMMMMDIDNFKQMNDTCGHDYGDKVICAVAKQLRRHFRKEDIIARMGGDEFSVFIGNIQNTVLVEAKARQFCESMPAVMIDGKQAGFTCSAGIALSTPTVNSFAALYQNSDKALYSAKCRGRNIVAIYGEESALAHLPM